MSILDHSTVSLNNVAIGKATLQNSQLFTQEGNQFSDRVAALFPTLNYKPSNHAQSAHGFFSSTWDMAESMATGISTQPVSATVTDSGYAGTGAWAIQLGEADMPNEPTRLFLNIVDPMGAIVLQVQGVATDRNFGDMVIHGGDWDHQLRVYAFAGDFFGDVPRYLHRPYKVGDVIDMQVLLGSLAEAADAIAAKNIDFMPTTLESACEKVADAQNENSVIRSLLSVVSAQYPDFPINETVGWCKPAGFERDLGTAVAQPFGSADEQPSLPSAPKGRVPSFSAKGLDIWFHGIRKQEYRTVIEPAVSPVTGG